MPIFGPSANGATANSEARTALDETTPRIEELPGLRPGEVLERPMERPARRVA